MNLPLITMPAGVAKEKLREYRAALHQDAEGEYAAATRAYGALARGRKLLNLRDAFRLAPVDQLGRPHLAIARADRKQVWLRWDAQADRVRFRSVEHEWRVRGRADEIRVQMGRTPIGGKDLAGVAMVPMTPPAQKGSRNLERHFVLWEVEQWAERRPLPDRDPYLLKHLAGDLCVVVAEWDLTEVERAIMGERTQ